VEWNGRQRAALRGAAARLYPKETQQRAFVDEVGLRAAVVGFEPSADLAWFNIIEEARKQNRIDPVLRRMRDEYPHDEELAGLEAGVLSEPLSAPDIGGSLRWRGPKSARPLLERIIGERSTLVPVSYLEIGLQRSRAVVRVHRKDGASGSGFLIERDVLITNHHVLPDVATAASAHIQLNYQQTVGGLSAEVVELALAPGRCFATSAADDWTAVAVEGQPTDAWGSLSLAGARATVGSRVNIIQHPGGGFKQLSFFSNVVVFVGGGRVQYLTDTLPGSSGSPVFDHEWNLVAVHHSGGWHTEPGGDAKEVFYRNEGIAIEVVVKGLEDAGVL
jgi:hypothetical protein